MIKKRNRMEVIHSILRIVREHDNSIRKTPLLRCSNLSSQGFNEYYVELVSKGFIRELAEKDKLVVSLTDKGFLFLQKYNIIKDFIQEFEL